MPNVESIDLSNIDEEIYKHIVIPKMGRKKELLDLVKVNIDKEELYNYMLLDKKRTNDYLQVICVNEIGTFEIRKEPIENIKKYL